MKYVLVGAAAALTIGTSFAEAQQFQASDLAEYGEGFGYLSAVRELPDGGVLVADPLGQLLVAIDLESGEAETWGREGAGPAEWRQPDAVFALPGGKTLLVDLGNGRLTTIGADGTFGETYPVVRAGLGGPGGGARGGRSGFSPPTMILPRAVDARGGIYFNPRSFSSDSTTVMRTTLDDDAMTALGNVKPQGMRRIEDGRSIQVVPLNMTPEDD